MTQPRLRGGAPPPNQPYPLGQIPDDVLVSIGKQIVHRLAVGLGDITGDDFGTIFAKAVRGVHRTRPIGLSDVEWNGTAWSAKTVKVPKPFTQTAVRLISGRNSPVYSLGIENPHVNPEATGRAVLAVWNARVNEGKGEHDDLRIIVMVRNIQVREFTLFEEEAQRFAPGDYVWQFNDRGNLEGYDRITGVHRFTWQPHGSQFTIIRDIPGSARRFSIVPNVPIVDPASVLAWARYRDDWIDIVG